MPFKVFLQPYRAILLITLSGFLVILAGLTFVGIHLNSEITQLTSQTNKIYQHPFLVNAAAHEASLASVNIKNELLSTIATRKDVSPLDITNNDLVNKIQKYDSSLDNKLLTIQKNFLGDLTQIQLARELAFAWKKERLDLISLLEKEHSATDKEFIKERTTLAFDKLQHQLDYVIDFSSKMAHNLVGQAQHKANLTRSHLTWLLFGFALFTLLTGVITLSIVLVALHQRDKTLSQIDQNLRIAATAFESQEGMIVSDANNLILRVNRAFSLITGYSAEEAIGQNPRFLHSGLQNDAFYSAMWQSINTLGKWEGEIWDKRKNGDIYPQKLIITAVTDHHGQVSNYVATMTDISEDKRDEQLRLASEIELRNTLVREVHHRIKNNLQGVTGVLCQCMENYPELAEPFNQVISQVQSISLIHGLQVNSRQEKVPLDELIASIATAVEALWKTPVTVDLNADSKTAYILETEAVPMALVLNELITNAAKHSKHNIHISIDIAEKNTPTSILIRITNAGQIPADFRLENTTHFGTGLQLLARLLPRSGTTLNWQQKNNVITTSLTLHAPIIQFNSDATYEY